MADAVYAYKPRQIFIYVLGLLFFGAGGFVLFNEASTNRRGMIINHIITLDPASATLVLWCLFGAAILACVLAIFYVYRALTSAAVLTFSPDGLTLPGNAFSNHITTIPWNQIRNIREISVRKVRFLELFHAGGKITINEAMLPKGAFDEVRNRILQILSLRKATSRGAGA